MSSSDIYAISIEGRLHSEVFDSYESAKEWINATVRAIRHIDEVCPTEG